jgi:hypothetical protein
MDYIECIGFTPKILKIIFLPIKSQKREKSNKFFSVCHAPWSPPPLTEIYAKPTA